MCYTAKASLVAWWILALMTLFIWYRNERYDRALAPFVFTLGLIQLIEYGVHNRMNASQAGRAIFLTLWLQTMILAIGVYIFVHTPIAAAFLVLFAAVFLVALLYSLVGDAQFQAQVGASGHVEWYKDGGFLLGSWSWLYLVGIFVPFLFLLSVYHWANVGIWLLLLYGVLSAIYVRYAFPPVAFGSMWCYLSIGFAFLLWMVGILPASACGTC